MKLSLIILNYKVPYFLEQCLASVYRSECNFEYEVFVVDNNSQDRSVEMVKAKFPQAKLIETGENLGFSKGNNVAIRQAAGEYVLLLNPDTIIDEHCLQATVDFMDTKADAGALGIKMLDGSGAFLPESKRGLPTPWIAFYKIFGLSKLFKKSKKFGKYHLTYLNKNEIHEVDILAGAFMLMRKSALDKVGLLDEQFFMYGEDIDLSYRIQQGGFKNYYFPDHPIIHYKGESTKTGSLNYVRVFYQAMILFAKKHFSGSKAFWFIAAINLAIYLRAGMALFKRLASKAAMVVVDAGLLYAGMMYFKTYWENNHRYIEGGSYPPEFMYYVVPGYILVWLTTAYVSGGYDKPLRLFRLIRGLAVGTLVLFAVYGLLPEAYRFSRALILLGAGWSAFILPSYRYALDKLGLFGFKLAGSDKKRPAVICNPADLKETKELLTRLGYPTTFLPWIQPDKFNNSEAIGQLKQLDALVDQMNLTELVFNAKQLSYQTIITCIERLEKKGISFKIIPPEADFMIGSDSAKSSGDAVQNVSNKLTSFQTRRSKRFLDLLLAAFSMLLLPIQKKPAKAFADVCSVLIAKKTWVGTSRLDMKINKTAILPVCYSEAVELTDAQQVYLEKDYLENYELEKDLKIWWKHRRLL